MSVMGQLPSYTNSYIYSYAWLDIFDSLPPVCDYHVCQRSLLPITVLVGAPFVKSMC
jgi:hypothetical protein